MQAVGVYLRTLRDLEGLSQKRAGERIGVASKTIERWEAGENEPPMTTLHRYAAALRGSTMRVTALLLAPNTDGEAGIKIAAERDWKGEPILPDEEREIMARFASLTGSRRQTAIAVLSQLLIAEERGEEP